MIYKNYQANPRVNKLLDIISGNPGMGFSDLARDSGLAHGVLSHYLSRMEKRVMIRVRQNNKRRLFFPLDSPPENDILLFYLRRETCRKILSFLLAKQSATFGEIVAEVKRSPSTVSLALTQLLRLKLVSKSGINKKYEVASPSLTKEALQKTNPTELDTLKDRFADTFSYF
ncbi:MAG: winged helix-turn-helix transcriptional regulator [Nitrosopumilaceae archaeon]